MRLSNIPPHGAGKVQHVTKTERLLKHIEGLGLDKFMNPIGIRTNALAEATGVPAKSIQALLDPHVASGRLCVCKVTVPGEQSQREYRQGTGTASPEFKPLNTRRAGIALRTATPRDSTAAPTALSTPKPASDAIETPTLIKPQPAVGNTGSTRSDSSTIPAEARAVTADEATPRPSASAELKKEPAVRTVSAGDVKRLRLAIDQDGVLQLGDDTDPARFVFTPQQTKQLGYFLRQTHDVWNPF